MKTISVSVIMLAVVFVAMIGVLYADNGITFEFPELMVAVLNLIVVPFLVQLVKKIANTYEQRAFIAAGLSFVTAIVGIIISGQGSFANILKLFVIAYSVAQIAYNLWWHRILQPE